MAIFRDQYVDESLNEFHDREVVRTRYERTRFGEDIRRVVECLQDQPFNQPYSVKEVFKSGSLAKGTAVKNQSDIDLVVFVNGLDSIDDLQEARNDLLYDMEMTLKRSLRGLRHRKGNMNDYGLSYTLNGVKLDIFPAFDVLCEYGSPDGVIREMKRYRSVLQAGQQFSVSLAPLQVQFVKPIPEYIKRVIRLLKYWKWENNLNIRAYSLELLTIFIWNTRCEENPGTEHLLWEVMRQLATCGTQQVSFDDNYNSYRYTRYMSPPYILDPANPFINTLHGVYVGEVSECAKRTLRDLNY